MRKAFLILVAAALLSAKCTDNFSASIAITPSLSEVPYTGGSVDITVMTDLPWKIVMDEECPATVSKETGIGDDVVTVIIPQTDSWTTGCVAVKFYSRSNSSSVTKTAYITQGYKPYVSVSGESGTIDQTGGSAQIVVTANSDWKASCDIPGVTFSPAEGGVGNYTVLVTFPANTTGSSRRITVNFSIDGDSDHFYFVQY